MRDCTLCQISRPPSSLRVTAKARDHWGIGRCSGALDGYSIAYWPGLSSSSAPPRHLSGSLAPLRKEKRCLGSQHEDGMAFIRRAQVRAQQMCKNTRSSMALLQLPRAHSSCAGRNAGAHRLYYCCRGLQVLRPHTCTTHAPESRSSVLFTFKWPIEHSQRKGPCANAPSETSEPSVAKAVRHSIAAAAFARPPHLLVHG